MPAEPTGMSSAKTLLCDCRRRTLATDRAGSKPSSRMVRLSLRPLMPPLSLISLTEASNPALNDAPDEAAPPVRGRVVPSSIVFLVPPCAAAAFPEEPAAADPPLDDVAHPLTRSSP